MMRDVYSCELQTSASMFLAAEQGRKVTSLSGSVRISGLHPCLRGIACVTALCLVCCDTSQAGATPQHLPTI